MTEASSNISLQAVTAPSPDNFRSDFEFTRSLPPRLRPLDAISRNFYWSWQPDGVALFRELDPALWDKVEQNPREFIKQIKGTRLFQRALDEDYLAKLDAFDARFHSYLSKPPAAPGPQRIAYFCAEYGVHNSLPIYSGGLGILAGDHLKSASDLGADLTAVGLLYRHGYFRQHVGHDGWQREAYNDLFESELALTPVNHKDGSRIKVSVHIRGREVFAQGWLACVGRIKLYLLDTNLPENVEVDRYITGHLYGGDTETRIVQEKVLGMGGVRLLRRLGIEPDVYHLNEGHAAFSTLELVREHLEKFADDDFETAALAVRKKCVFTTHTPVAAGNDMFPPDELIECFSKEFIASLKITDNEFLTLGRADITDDKSYFGMTPLAIRMCRSSNGVSQKHGEVSRELWLRLFPDLADSGAVPISSVTNGVHPATWIAPAFQRIFANRFGEDWCELSRDGGRWWDAVNSIPDDEIWTIHGALKGLLIAFLRQRTSVKDAGGVDTIHEHENIRGLFSPEVLTVGFARRVAAYKRWDLIFSDLDRLLKMVDNEERPVQFVFAGKAHPQDKTAKSILQKLMQIDDDSNWQRRAVFIEDYDQEVARYLVQGVDVWMNVPRRPMEASGTSGMKAAMNGVLNFSILDGWWIEGFNRQNGFKIGEIDAEGDDQAVDLADAESLYSTLENEIITEYYARNDEGLPVEWIARMKNAIATLTPHFSSDRMVSEYFSRIYSEEQ